MSELPNGWRHVSFGECCNPRGETVNPATCPELPYIGLEHIDSGVPVLLRRGCALDVTSTKARFQTNDILFGKLRPNLRKSVLAAFEGVCSTDILVFKPNADVDARYLSYTIHSNGFIEYAVKSVGGVNLPRTSWTALRSFELCLPPLTEQRTIVRSLRTVQDAQDARRRELELERERKTALMEELFTRGTRGEALKETEIGPMPESWETTHLGALIFDGPQNGLYKPASHYDCDGVPILRIDAFKAGDVIQSQNLKRLQITPEEIENFRLVEGDLVINRVNGNPDLVGKCAVVGKTLEPTVFESNMMRFSVQANKIAHHYLLRFLCTDGARRQIRLKARIINQASINQQDVEALKVSLPSLAEQHNIASVLSACDAKIAALEAEAALHDELFRALLEDLMAGRISTAGVIEMDASPESREN